MAKSNASFWIFILLSVMAQSGFTEVVFLTQQNQGNVEPQIEIKTTSANEIVINFKIFSLFRSKTSLGGSGRYHSISIPNFSNITVPGEPALPVWNKFIAVPLSGDVSASIEIHEVKELGDVYVAPAPEPQREDAAISPSQITLKKSIYNADAFYPRNAVNIGEVKIVRGQAMVLLSVYPARFNPVKKSVEILTDFSIRISLPQKDGSKTDFRYQSEIFDLLFENLLLNWQKTKSAQPSFKPAEVYGADYLIITPKIFSEAADSLSEWRRLNGLITKVVTLEETGATADEISAYLQSAYDNWDVVPVYVLLLGDAEFIPMHYITLHPTKDNGRIGTDLYYAALDGTDFFPDLIIGRIPVDEPLEAKAFVNKVIGYEKNPVLDEDFYRRAEVIAYFEDDDDPDTPDYNERDGYADRRFVLTSEEIRNMLLTKGYDAQRIYYAKPEVTPANYNNGKYANGEPLPPELLRSNGFLWNGNAADISAGIEQGCFLVTHRDHGSRAGWGYPSYKASNVRCVIL